MSMFHTKIISKKILPDEKNRPKTIKEKLIASQIGGWQFVYD
jgi:hypothetical protein